MLAFFSMEAFVAGLGSVGPEPESKLETLLRCCVPIGPAPVLVIVFAVRGVALGAAVAVEVDASSAVTGAGVVGGISAGGTAAIGVVVVSLTSPPSTAEKTSLQSPSWESNEGKAIHQTQKWLVL